MQTLMEIVQEVMVSVSRAVQRWQPGAQLGRFRDWLFRIARNLMINFMTRRHHQSIASGGEMAKMMEQQIDPNCEESAAFDLEYHRELFRWAAEQVQDQVKPATWQAFWMTSVEEIAIPDVAAKLGISVGAVHIARSRVRSRLRDVVTQWEQQLSTCSKDDQSLGRGRNHGN